MENAKKNERFDDHDPRLDVLFKKEARTRIIRTAIKCVTLYYVVRLIVKK